MNYIRVCQGKASRGILVPEDKAWEHVKDPTKDYYFSHFIYNDKHKELFDRTQSVAGITDTVTNKLVFDLDSKDDLEQVRKDGIQLVERLLLRGIKQSAIQIFYSGMKGLTIVIETTKTLTPTQLKQICFYDLGKDLSTLDSSVYNANRIMRVPGTRHEVSGLYKIPLSYDQLKTFTIEKIKQQAKSLDNVPEELTYDIAEITVPTENIITTHNVTVSEFSLENKPKFLTNCRYALQNGIFKEGERSKALLCLAASYKNIGFEKEHTYRLLKGVAEMQATRSQTERFPDSEIWNNIITQVYGPSWKNGQFSCREKGNWLHDYCQNLGDKKCDHDKEDKNLIVAPNEVFDMFKDYTLNYEKNILFTGIESLDRKMKLMVGTSNAILAAPGVGKSSLALSILNHNSKQNNRSIFFSYDMYHSALYMRMLQKHTGKSQDEIYRIFKNGGKDADKLNEIITREYKNISFCFKSGQTPEEIENTIRHTEDKYGEKVRLIIVDYSELVTAGVSDSTAASAQVAQRLRQIANDRSVCNLTLLQPSKQFSSPADEITNYNASKGSSSITQALTLLLACCRPGFNPLNPSSDKFFNITCLKNRNGPLFSLDYGWSGLEGNLYELDDMQRDELFLVRKERDERKKINTEAWD